MTQALLAMLALYFIAVGAAGNGRTLWNDGMDAVPGFLPWAGVIFVLGILAVNKDTEALGKPLVILILLVYLIKDNNFTVIEKSIVDAYDILKKQLADYAAPVAQTAAQTKAETSNSQITNMANIEKKGIL